VQNGFHDIISQRGNSGWGSQLQDEPVVQLTSSRVYRVKLWQGGGIETDMLPELTAGLGTLRTYVEAGVTLRVGQGLDADYGVARVRPGGSGGDVFQAAGKLGWYVFAGVDAKGVARDGTLDGNLFTRSLHVHREPFVGEGHAGFALLFAGARLTYSHVLQSSEFKSQKGGLHQFGSLALSMRF
ncbi:MAG: lipid A deacylase LpxR family protein, partial [Alphaproteobacteria bacterium]|nr:lipid A deacylase LpxR family protein [Alphaproteobacteria bacterium]